MSKTITEEEVKAFIDDLAFIQHKHGLVLNTSGEIIRHDYHTVVAHRNSNKQPGFEWKTTYTGGPEDHVWSEDFEKMSAHEIMLWKRKQREILGGHSVSGKHNGTMNGRALTAMRRLHPKA